MSKSLTDGVGVALCRIGYCGHWISILLNVHVWGHMQNMVDTRDELLQQIFNVVRHVNDAAFPCKATFSTVK
jgi:hypothetical protein